jgi:hypothetical protein
LSDVKWFTFGEKDHPADILQIPRPANAIGLAFLSVHSKSSVAMSAVDEGGRLWTP